MADDSSSTGGVPGSVRDLITQLRGVTDKLTNITGLAGLAEALPSLPSLPALPRPAALSAAQLSVMTSTIVALRRSVDAMQFQLSTFNEQLAVVERLLEPLTEWTGTLADLETALINLRPRADGRRDATPEPGDAPSAQEPG